MSNNLSNNKNNQNNQSDKRSINQPDNSQRNNKWQLVRFAAIAIILLVMVGMINWLLRNVERVSEEKEYLSLQAKNNPYLMAQVYLNKVKQEDGFASTDFEMNLVNLLDNLPSIEGVQQQTEQQHNNRPTIVIRQISNELADSKYAEFMEWVQAGGHIITFADKNNGLVEYLDLEISFEDDVDRYKDMWDKEFSDDFSAELDRIGLVIPEDDQVDNKAATDKTTNKIGADTAEKESKKRHQATWQNSHTDRRLSKAEIEAIRDQLDDLLYSRYTTLSTLPSTAALLDTEHKPPLIYDPSIDKDAQSVLLLKASNYNLFTHSQVEGFYESHQQARPYYQTDDTDAASNEKTAIKVRAAIIRQYFKAQLALLKTDLDNGQFNNGKLDQVYNLNKEIHKLPQTIEYMLKLDDKYLVRMLPDLSRYMLDSRYGKGRITVLVADDIWQNANIYEKNFSQEYRDTSSQLMNLFTGHQAINIADNAKLLALLTADSDSVLFLPIIDIDPFVSIIWKNHFWVVLGLLVLLILWLWSLNNRFGKQLVLNNNHTQDISKYFRQVGRYAWEYDAACQLAEPAQQQAIALIKKRLGISENDALTTAHIQRLQEILQQQLVALTHSLDASNGLTVSKTDTNTDMENTQHIIINSKIDTDVIAMLVDNKAYIDELISMQVLILALTTSVRQQKLSVAEFQQKTQSLWLLKLLLNHY